MHFTFIIIRNTSTLMSENFTSRKFRHQNTRNFANGLTRKDFLIAKISDIKVVISVYWKLIVRLYTNKRVVNECHKFQIVSELVLFDSFFEFFCFRILKMSQSNEAYQNQVNQKVTLSIYYYFADLDKTWFGFFVFLYASFSSWIYYVNSPIIYQVFQKKFTSLNWDLRKLKML